MTTVLITGGHSGIGLECSRQLASTGCNLVLAGRSAERMAIVAKSLQNDFAVQVDTIHLDTASLTSVREAVVALRSLITNGIVAPIDALLCNAGAAGQNPLSYSPDGYEVTFAANCLGHFLLINQSFDLLAKEARIIFTASGTHDPDTGDGRVGSPVEPNAHALALMGKNDNPVIGPQSRYSTSKLCTVLYAYELDRRLRRSQSSVSSIAFDPGGISESSFARGLPKFVQSLIRTRITKWIMKRLGVNVGSLPVAGKSLAQLAVDPLYSHVSGKYFQANETSMRERRSSKASYDGSSAQKLWEDSKTLAALNEDEVPPELR